MTDTVHLATMSPHTAEMSTASLIMSLVVVSLAFLLPALVVALAVLKSPERLPDGEGGLGSVSLHDELWDFVSAVENGDVTLSSLDAADMASADRMVPTTGSPNREVEG